VVVVVEALGLARREIGGPDLRKPGRRCAYMQSVRRSVSRNEVDSTVGGGGELG